MRGNAACLPYALAGVGATSAQIAQVDRIRRAWTRYFAEQTESRGAMVTTLNTDSAGSLFVNPFLFAPRCLGPIEDPCDIFNDGRSLVPPGGDLVLLSYDYGFTGTLSDPMTIHAVLGPVTFGK